MECNDLSLEEENLRIAASSANYYNWQYDKVKDYLKGNVLEIGSGTGVFTKKMLCHPK